MDDALVPGMQVCPACGAENPAGFRMCGYCGTSLAPPAPVLPSPEERKTVTIVFSDLVGSTSLGERIDPEAMSGLLNRYFEVMTAICRRHGGSIQKFIGDAIVAVFGLPKVHEDDALRAVRAAHEMQIALGHLNEELERTFGTTIEARIGVNTGEIVAGEAVTGQQVVTGDTANVAARLEQAAPPMEVVLGGSTYRLVRDAVEVEPMDALELKGKAEPVAAYRLLAVHGTDEGVARRVDTPLVGREAEMEELRAAYRRAVGGRRCHAVTLVGDAGVGKSRLIREFLGSLGDEPRVLRGRALSYGEGITFWPLGEVVRDAAGIDIDMPAQLALDKLQALVGDPEIVERLASAIGLSSAQYPLTELFWGTRRFLEELAHERPVVVLIEDIHWAEPTFLDLLEHLTENLADAPVLVLATARHDLLESRPGWGQAACSVRVSLEGLSEAQVASVAANLLGEAGLPPALRDRIARASGGNPLFVEQMLSMLVDDGTIRATDGSWQVSGDLREFAIPPTIQALLAARLDRLVREERAVAEPAAVIGVEFPTPAVTDLAPDAIRPQVASLLSALTEKQLLRPTGSVIVGYRFNHQLIRDTAYQAILKRARAALHERYADWLTAHEGDRFGEVEEVIAYHLEQAHLTLQGLGPIDDRGRALAERAAALLETAGRQAFAREDWHAAINLLKRAVALAPDSSDARGTELLLAEALHETGAYAEAGARLEGIESTANATGDLVSAAKARLLRIRLELMTSPGPNWATRALFEADRTLPTFEAAEDWAGASQAWRLRYLAHGTTGRLAEAASDAEQVIELARRAGDERQRLRGLQNLAIALTYGPTPAADAAGRLDRLSEEVTADRATGVVIQAARAQLLAMRREFETARSLYRQARETARELGQPVLVAQLALDAGEVELRAGEPALAEEVLTDASAVLAGVGETFILASLSSMLGRAFIEQGRIDEALAEADRAAKLAADDDLDAQARGRGLRAVILLAKGDSESALAAASEAVELARSADVPMVTAQALADLAGALRAAGRDADADVAAAEARSIYLAKGDIASADRLAILSRPP
ncbi:MAG TPA: adenylate/guanylate cyclase domain-containing protein [Candidatus Limnocylindria bacterium]|nr:adenylate/guanylate cyclase domain-containing protein [Candidatus Limnocylindria bacterium]